MQTLRAGSIALLVTAIVAPTALAQEQAPAPAPEGLSAPDAAALAGALAGSDQWLELRYQDRRFGRVHFTGKRTEAGGVEIAVDSLMKLGPAEQRLAETLTLDAALAVTGYRKTETAVKPGLPEMRVEVEMARGEDGQVAWKQVQAGPGRPEPEELSGSVALPAGAFSSEMTSFVIALLDWDAAKSYRIQVLGAPASGAETATATLERIEKVTVRGRESQAHVIRLVQPSGPTALHYVAGGKLLRLVPEGGPAIDMIGGTREEVLAEAEESADQKAVRAAVSETLLAMNVGDVETVKRRVDFAALHAYLAARVKDFEALTAEGTEKLFLDSFARNAEGMDEARRAAEATKVDSAMAILAVKVEGDRALATLPQEPRAVDCQLARAEDGSWRIVGGTMFSAGR